MCKLLGQHLLHFRWKPPEKRNLGFFSKIKNKEGFFFWRSTFPRFVCQSDGKPMKSPVFWRCMCVLLHDGLYQLLESRSACLGGKWQWAHKVPSRPFFGGFAISVRLCINLCTLPESFICALLLLTTIAPILDVENYCWVKYFLFFCLFLLHFCFKENNHQKPNQ